MSTTILEQARNGVITEEMKTVADAENLSAEHIREAIVNGTVVILLSQKGPKKSVGIGRGLRTKVNASIGTSTDIIDRPMELQKAAIAQQSGADTLMELSTGGDLNAIRQAVIEMVDLPVGNVPLYQAAADAKERFGSMVEMTDDLLFDIIENQCNDGISFMAIHCGINQMTLERLRNQNYRHGGIVSRGGAFLVSWMEHQKKENPLFDQFDRLVDILKRYDVTLSFGNGMRAGAIDDSSDRAQIQELIINCELADRAREAGVQAIIEGPGHIPIDEIETNVKLQKRLSGEKPFYMLGPITTDISPGYDHITAAVGASIAASHGTDFICYVTPAEHLALPYPEDVKEGVMAARTAAHIGDMIKNDDRKQDKAMSLARRQLDWEKQFKLSLDPEKARTIKEERQSSDDNKCSMCGDFCAINIANEHFSIDSKR